MSPIDYLTVGLAACAMVGRIALLLPSAAKTSVDHAA
jgi:hypothetical protein